MKRATITMDEYGRVAVPSDAASVWMSEMELVKFFDVIAPTLRAAIRAVYKSGGLNERRVESLRGGKAHPSYLTVIFWKCMPCQWSLHLPSISTHPMPQGCAMPFWKGCVCEKTDKFCGFR